MLLTIGIPTYNRANELDYNLSLLTKSIVEHKLCKEVCIMISDNASTDNTQDIVSKHQKQGHVVIEYVLQKENTGIELNTLYVVRNAQTPYVMTLGDDDYLGDDYISVCIEKIRNLNNLGLIIPNKCAIDPETKEERRLANKFLEEVLYEAGFIACLNNAHLGHQLSGIVFKKDESILAGYTEKRLHNFYPTIYLAGAISLKYDVLYTGKVYVKVSDVENSKKDWSKDLVNGDLATQAFQNFKALGLSKRQRAELEGNMVKQLPFVIWNYQDEKLRNRIIENIILGKNTSFLGAIKILRIVIGMSVYSGWKYRLLFEVFVRIDLIKRFLTGKAMGI